MAAPMLKPHPMHEAADGAERFTDYEQAVDRAVWLDKIQAVINLVDDDGKIRGRRDGMSGRMKTWRDTKRNVTCCTNGNNKGWRCLRKPFHYYQHVLWKPKRRRFRDILRMHSL